MTDPAVPQHRVDLDYAETSLGETDTRPTVQTSPDGAGLVVSAICPRCFGPTETEYRYGSPGTGVKRNIRSRLAARRTRRPAGPEPDPVGSEAHYCECGHIHPGQPADLVFFGCGASWRVRGAVGRPGSGGV
ncbi:hypothetical protein J7E96_16705 [Streptomyces sp. ISL-96]|uniref:hypothetical protein n=1 Tax=Streptomyces sp. ISL-96 TaxID=2819191 RepID=UPI001BECF0DD|nr:hypothetical protein [Streptomyces sp. ISL-96]MBT2490128.1 hypothetical protein [Streptomyces sp. ISL-96]